MANQKLLQVLIGKCKDMGLSEKSIEEIAGIAGNGLKDGSTDEEIEAQANLFMPMAKAMQSEATRWAQAAKEKTLTVPPTPQVHPKPDEAGELDKRFKELEEKYTGLIDKQGKTITELQTKLNDTERNNTISAEMTKLGLTTGDMEYITVPSDANVPEFLGKVKQSLVNRGLKPADTDVTKEAKDKANEELAKTMLDQFTVKQD
jgi:hypothetical protein